MSDLYARVSNASTRIDWNHPSWQVIKLSDSSWSQEIDHLLDQYKQVEAFEVGEYQDDCIYTRKFY